jgi:SAM-dependent methyltransferase
MSDQSAMNSAPAWPLIPEYPPDLFRGAATYYALHRPAYPQRLLDDLGTRANVSGTGKLLDLACGTGEVALALHESFREVWAIDLEPEMVDAGRAKATKGGVANVRWMIGRAEDVDAPAGSFELVTSGNAFHRLDRRLVAHRVLDWLAPGCCFAVLGSSSLWSGKADWQAIASDVVREWTDHPGRAAVASPDQAPSQPRQTHQGVLEDAGFEEVTEYQFPTQHVWTLDSFIGYLYSTSVGSKVVRSGVADEFEAALRQRLLAYDTSGRYAETIEFYYILARRPTLR